MVNIQEETGIIFSIDPTLKTTPFSASVQTKNWEAAIRELLKEFSRVEVWTYKLQTSRVWVLSGGNNQETTSGQGMITLQSSKPAPTRPVVQRQPRFRTAPAPAPKANLKMRVEDLPPHILYESGVLTFFKANGIALPNNVKSMFGPNLEGLPANMPISPHILNDPTFKNFLQSKGLSAPVA